MTDCKLQPVLDRIIIQRVEKDEKSSGGIIIPDSAQEKTNKGIVIVVGPGKYDQQGKLIPMSVKEGDRIIFQNHAGYEIEIDGKEFLVIDNNHILCVVK